MAIITSGIQSSGTPRAYRSPARTWPFARSATGPGRSCCVRISFRPSRTARYERPSIVKHHPYPATWMSRPASAGPTIRALVISAVLRLTALWMWSSGTISTTNARRAGLSNASVTPPTSATA